jgi:hypothetical protein
MARASFARHTRPPQEGSSTDFRHPALDKHEAGVHAERARRPLRACRDGSWHDDGNEGDEQQGTVRIAVHATASIRRSDALCQGTARCSGRCDLGGSHARDRHFPLVGPSALTSCCPGAVPSATESLFAGVFESRPAHRTRTGVVTRSRLARRGAAGIVLDQRIERRDLVNDHVAVVPLDDGLDLG